MELTLPKLNEKFLNTVIFPRPKKVIFKLKPERCLRVVTFNVHFGQKVSAIVEALENNANLAQADVILLQEIEHHTKESMPRAAQIAKALKLNFVYAPARKISLNRGTHGVAILSRFLLQETEAVRLPYFDLPLRRRPRIALKAKIESTGKKISIYNVHLDATLNYRDRIKQLQIITNDIQSRSGGEPVILGGDFNTIPLLLLGRAFPIFYSNQKKKLNAYLKSAGFNTRCQSVGYTYVFQKGLARFQLDGIYTKSAPLIQFALERSVKVSDHFPLWADIKIS